MSTLNEIIVLGNIGNDPEIRYTANRTAVCNFSVATNRFAKEGEEPVTDWHRVTCWGKQAEAAAQYLGKGSKVCVRGEMQYSQYEDNDGNTRTSADIQVRPGGLVFLDRRESGGSDRESSSRQGGGRRSQSGNRNSRSPRQGAFD